MEIEFENESIDMESELSMSLRKIAAAGGSIRKLVDEVRIFRNVGNEGICFEVVRAFRKAFRVGIREVRDIEGAMCVGRSLYNDTQIDDLLLPKIQETKHLWMPGGVPCRQNPGESSESPG